MKRVFLYIYVCLVALLCEAQQTNVIKVPDIAALADRETTLCVYLNNTSNDIVAMQMDLMLPQGMTIDASSAALSNRAGDHVLQVKPTNGGYRFMVYSPQNQPLHGNSGLLLTVNARLDDHFLSNNEYPMAINRATLGDSDGNNVLTSTECGSIKIQPSPDFVVTSLAASPQSISPEGEIMLSWTVVNQGLVSSTGGWSEQILLVDDNGGKTLLGRTYFNDPLQSGEAVSRQATIKVPQLPGLEGNVKAQIQLSPNSDSGERPENQTNNTTTGDDRLFLAKSLFVEMPTSVTESNRTIACKLMRSGSWQSEESFRLTLVGDNRVTAPQTATIAKGSSSAVFHLVLSDNNLLDNDSIIKISIEGNDYPAIHRQLVIDDNEYPNLTLTASKSAVTEGETFLLTITTSRVSKQPIVVTLTSENAKRFTYPQSVTIPSGEKSVTVDVTAVDDESPSLEWVNAFTASALKHNKAEVNVVLNDNDLPVLELQLTPTTVQESAGVVAVAGVLRRTTNTNSKITVKLVDDADGGLYFGNRTLTLDKGVEEVHFNFGPVDNAIVDGDRTYTITAAVWLSSCGCGASSNESAGYVTVQLQVLDNDGAALSLTSSLSSVKEGGKTMLTVSRNTSDTSKPLKVTLSSNYEEGLTYQHTVTIPAGQQSVTVEVTSADNNVQGDSHTVIFTVQADGFATGTCYLNVTDQTMPDARITDLRADRTQIEVGEQLSVTVVVVNEGVAVLPAGTEVALTFSGSSSKKLLYTPADLAIGESVDLTDEYTIPSTKPGNYTLKATINADQGVKELNYNNNTSQDLNITLLPNFTATVSTDKKVYRQGETIVISGQTSAGGRNANVEVYLVNGGARQSIMVQADAEGHFETIYQLYNRQAGHFTVGACYPGIGETVGSTEVDVYGLRLANYFTTHDISLGDEAKGKIVIENPGQLPQTGMTIVPQAEIGDNELSLGSISAIEPDGQIEISYTLKGNALTDGNDWQQIPLHITTAEGSTADYTIYYYVRSLKGKLKASQTRIETTITKGVPRDYQFQISNIGRGETGRITLSLPSWVESLTPIELPSLSQNDTTTIVLRLKTTDDMQLNVPVTGQIGINCEQGDGVPVSLKVMPVSESTGKLVIDVVDENSFYAEGKPHVEGAKVLVTHPTTGQVVALGMTASDGHYSVELSEGWYTVSISADKHQSYQTTLEVAPGQQTGKEIFLTYEAISYTWEVVETEVEDEYEIETVVKYETNVPKPVIVITLPDEKPEVGSVIPVIVTNKGLISANDVDVTLSVTEGLSIEWLTDPTLAVLAPQQSAVFYAVLKENTVPSARRRALSDVVKAPVCIFLYVKLLGYYVCGEYEKTIAVESSRAWGKCLSSSSSGGNGGGSGWGGNSGWNNGGGYPNSHPSYGPGSNNNEVYNHSMWVGPNLSPTAKICHEKDIEELTLPPVYNGTPLIYGSPKEINWSPIMYDLDGYVYEVYQSPVDNSVPVVEPDIIGYEIFDNGGEHRVARGVAADGAAKVDIRLKGTIPFVIADFSWVEDGEEPWDGFKSYDKWFEWSLKEGIGELENTDHCRWVTYKAPEDFPGGPNESEVTIHVVFNYCNSDGEIQEPVEIPVVIARAPLVLLHGLGLGKLFGGGESTWSGFKRKLCEEDKDNMYSEYQVLNEPYTETNTAAFKTNLRVAGDRIWNAIKRYQSHGIVAKKADLVGHSMGGVLSRLHVQYANGGTENVHKVITVNTPHSGSPIGDMMGSVASGLEGYTNEQVDKINRWKSYKNIFDEFWGLDSRYEDIDKIDMQAVADLGVNSDATDNYLNNPAVLDKMNDIPIHAIVTDVTGLTESDIEYLSGEDKSLLEFLEISKKMSLNYSWKDDTDLIVSVQSQKGGLESPFFSTIHDQWHSSTDNDNVQKRLIELLNAPIHAKDAKDQVFCFTGFRPNDISLEDYQIKQPSFASAKRRVSAVGVEPTLTVSVNDNMLTASMAGAEGYDYQLMLVQFGKEAYSMVSGSQIECEVPAFFSGDVTIYGVVRMEGEDIQWSKTQVNIAVSRANKESISASELSIYYDESQPVSLTCTWSDGSQTRVIPDEVTFTDDLAYYENGYITGLHGGSGTATFTYQGLTCEAPFTVYNFGKKDDEESSKSVCSTITLKLSQTMTMTRQAFRGTLTMINGNEAMSMKDVKLALKVTNVATGEEASSHEFQINAESIDGFTGEIDLASGWTLAGNRTGTATILFIPTKYAAPTEPVEWSFGGTLSYLDPFTGRVVTRDLYPVTLTVKPSPELDLTYFMQRDVYGDDPLTLDVVEPMKPAEFALLINNKGYGDAIDVRMMTQQPEIIENEKGLHIDFELISSQVNGGDAALSFGKGIANDFGTIPAHSQMYAQWWLTSTLLGHFTEYDVHATHVTSYGNPDLSLLDQVTIHELIHSFDMPKGSLTGGPEKGRAFLVNDIVDANDQPDRLYFTNGNTADVAITTTAEIERTSPTTCLLTVTPSVAGWNYGNLLDPTQGYAELKSIVRQSDGQELGNTCFWQTDRTLRDGKDWLYEYRLHFVDEFKAGAPVTYLLTFDLVPEEALEVAYIGDIPEEGSIAEEPLETLIVTFNKKIDASTFTADDITLAVQGVKQDVSKIGISTDDNQSFVLDMTAVNSQLGNGYYTLTVQCTGITDAEGFQGKVGKQAGWIMFRGGLVQLLTSAWPKNSGTVIRKSNEEASTRHLAKGNGNANTAKYGSTFSLVAVPDVGYEFANWTLNGEAIAADAELEMMALGDMDVVANFTKKRYMVNVGVDGAGGSITGAATGIYEHNAEIGVTAVPEDDYALGEWSVNGKAVVGDGNVLSVTVDRPLDVKATFVQEYFYQTVTLDRGWNWISAYLSEPWAVKDLGLYAGHIVSQTGEVVYDPESGWVGNLSELSAGKAYKVDVNSRFTNTFRGHLYNVAVNPISLHQGWNWVAYPFMGKAPMEVVTTAEEGDFIVSQTGFAEYADGVWTGTLDRFTSGEGYLYKSVSEKNLEFDNAKTSSDNSSEVNGATVTDQDVDIRRYPNTMNVTASIRRDGSEVLGEGYNIYAMVGDELRGFGQYVAGNHYLTVYGDQAADVTFFVESVETGETFEAYETLVFRDDVVGSRKSPFVIHIGDVTGINPLGSNGRMTIYTIEGVLVSRDATMKTLLSLPKGVYIVSGKTVRVK